MIKKLTFAAISALILGGCSTVPLELPSASETAKNFETPPNGQAGLYIYRDSVVGTALKKDIWVDGKCVGETAPNVFFYETVKGDEEHKISTESEFSPNDLVLKTDSGKNYFIRQYIKLGVFVGGANLELVNDTKGQQAISKLKLAKKGACSK